LNQVLGAKVSIVTPKAQTTRERVLGILTEKNQGQMIFVDTPGIHRAREGGINAFMVNEAREALEGTSAVWYIVDPSSSLEHEAVVLELLEGALRGARQEAKVPVLVLMNKADQQRADPARVEAFERELMERLKAVGLDARGPRRISALKARGTRELLDETWALLPEGPLYYPDEEQLSDRPTRFFVGEKIREQLLLQLGQELPYSCAVQIENFDEQARPPRIEAVIHVERESQKGMVVGKGGQKIKSIGQAARGEVEEFLGHQVFLGLRVKVLPEWSRDPESLRRLGYNLPGGKSSRPNSKHKKRGA
jgi:GTP-binding protein Era